jgi:hypothetical protein
MNGQMRKLYYEQIDDKYYLMVQTGEIMQKAIITSNNLEGFTITTLQNQFEAKLESTRFLVFYGDHYLYFENEEMAKTAVEWIPTAPVTKKLIGA